MLHDTSSGCNWCKIATSQEVKEKFVKEGIYYYKKSKGESVTPEEVLAMSWDEVIEYRRRVAEEVGNTTKSMSLF